MSVQAEVEELLSPLSADKACGDDLEDTQLLASFDAYRLFGQMMPLTSETDWRAIKEKSLEALRVSKDLRILGHYASAALRVDGWAGFFAGVTVAAAWIKDHWADVYPRVDDDAILRKNALNTLSDRMSVLDGLRRMPIAEHRQLGRISLRDVDIATGQLAPAETDTAPVNETQVAAVFAATATEDLQSRKTGFEVAIHDLQAIDAKMRDFGGPAASPDFEPLLALLTRVDKLLGEHLNARGATGAAAGDEGSAASTDGGAAIGAGGIRSRQDALRAIDAIAAYFRQNEPSSPVPLLLERAKNLIGKDFLEILADVAPDGVASARNAGGLKD
jgi:type VI secretion system protein ImpA